jgi:hypothetical protein
LYYYGYVLAPVYIYIYAYMLIMRLLTANNHS